MPVSSLQFIKREIDMATRAYTVNDAAQRLGLSRRKVYQLIAGGQLGSIKIDKSRRITDEQLTMFLSRLQKANDAVA